MAVACGQQLWPGGHCREGQWHVGCINGQQRVGRRPLHGGKALVTWLLPGCSMRAVAGGHCIGGQALVTCLPGLCGTHGSLRTGTWLLACVCVGVGGGGVGGYMSCSSTCE